MADTAIAITAGTGTNVDTRTEGTNGNHRQVMVIGDPATNAGVAPVDGTAGLKVDLGADNDVTVSSSALPTGAATSAKQDTAIGHLATLAGAVAGTEVQVDIVSGGITVSKAAAAALSNVADTASSTTLKASNASRLGLIIVNDSTVDLYVKYGATASATSFTYKLGPGETLREELYTGIVDGIWASDASGSARVTELTAA